MNIRNLLVMLIAVFALTFTVGCDKKDAEDDAAKKTTPAPKDATPAAKGPTPESICKKADKPEKCLKGVTDAKAGLDAAMWKELSACLDKKDKLTKADMMGCLNDKMMEQMGAYVEKERKKATPATKAAIPATKGPTPESICKKSDDKARCTAMLTDAQAGLDAAMWKEFSTCLDKKDKILKADMRGCTNDKIMEQMGAYMKNKRKNK